MAALKRYGEVAAKLSGERKRAAKRFGEAVTAVVRTPGMPNAQFAVALETDTESAPRAAGVDSVRFDFSANPGQPPRTLAKVARSEEHTSELQSLMRRSYAVFGLKKKN